MQFFLTSILIIFVHLLLIDALSSTHSIEIELELNTASAFAWVEPGFVGLTLAFQSVGGDTWRNASVIDLDFKEPSFIYLIQQLSPAIIRVGGGREYLIVMDVNGTECREAKTPRLYCLTMERWQMILEFAKTTGAHLVWSLGAQKRINGTSPLDMANIEDFLAFTAKLQSKNPSIAGIPYGFELGNELDGGDYKSKNQVDPYVFAADYIRLAKMIKKYWPNRINRPKLVGPGMHEVLTFAIKFLGSLPNIPLAQDGDGLDKFTFHDYAGYGLDPKLEDKIMDPTWRELYWTQAAPVVESAKNLAPLADIWVGETSSAWHSGRCGVTDRFTGSFWYANALGKMARQGVSGFARHCFNGGCYAVMQRKNHTLNGDISLNPDYFIAKLYHDLMDTKVLDVSKVLGTNADSPHLSVYAHTAKRFLKPNGDGATMLLINSSPTEEYNIVLSAAPGLMTPRYEYVLTASSLDAAALSLNGGDPLMFDNIERMIPALDGLFVNDSSPLIISPYSIVFVELPDATVY